MRNPSRADKERCSQQAHIGIITSERAHRLTEDGKKLMNEMVQRDMQAEPVVWDDEDADWSKYDGVLVRSCWDYHKNPDKFLGLLKNLEESGVTVVNPVDIIEWNIHKSYLRDLAEEEIPIIPTVLVEEQTELKKILLKNGWKKAVVKPAIGTSSEGLWRVSVEEATEHQEKFEKLISNGDVLVQEFVNDIHDGERSFVFFKGEYSHSWKVYPPEDDFRTHPNYGGSTELDYEPSPGLIEGAAETVRTASEILEIEPEDLTYARVDGIERGDELRVMELELIEPYLHLEIPENGWSKMASVVESQF